MTVVDALQHALAVEHQVIYGYGVLGAHLSDRAKRTGITPSGDDARSRLEQHLELRDRIAALVQRHGDTPVAAEPAYQLPFAVTDASAALRLGRQLEDDVAAAGYAVIAASGPRSPERRLMVASLSAAADWSARWALAELRPFAAPFPGQPVASKPSTTPTSSPS